MDTLMSKVKEVLKNKHVSEATDALFIKKIEALPGICIGIVTIHKDFVNMDLKGDINLSACGVGKNIINRIKTYNRQFLTSPVRFFLSLHDGIVFPEDVLTIMHKHIIILLFCDFIEAPLNEIIIPDPYIMEEETRKLNTMLQVSSIPFIERIPIAKFRGAQTGSMYNMEEVVLMRLPRLKAAHISLKYPHLLDARFITSYNIQNDGGAKYMYYMYSKFGEPSAFEPFEESIKNRYLLSLDGNYVSFARPEMLMSSGSVPLIQTEYIKYWSPFLETGKNYIKIDNDLGNLIESITWLNDNPIEAQRIAENAQKLAKEVITPSFMDQYFLRILHEIFESTMSRSSECYK